MLLRTLQKMFLWVILPLLVLVLMTVFFIVFHYDDYATQPADCAVIFGAAVWRDAIPSSALYDRTRSAAELYERGLVHCIILSGGPSTYGAHEVDVMQTLLLDAHIPPEALITDYNGFKTVTTLNNLDKDRSYILVSNDFHLARIGLLAQRADLTAFALHGATYYNNRYVREPYFFFREVVGTLYYFFGLHRAQIFFY